MEEEGEGDIMQTITADEWSKPKYVIRILAVALVLRLIAYGVNPQFQSMELHGDSYYHYMYALSFFTEKPYYSDGEWLSYRPPLEDIIHGFSMKVVGVSHWGATVSSIIFGLFAVLSIRLLGEGLYDAKIGNAAALLAAVNWFMIRKSIELEPRVFIITFVCMTFYFLLRDEFEWAAAFTGLSLLTHYSSIVFILPMVVWRVHNWRTLMWMATIVFVVLSPWFIRNLYVFNDPLYSTSRQIPLISSLSDFGTNPTIASYVEHTGMFKVVGNRAINLVTSIFPPPWKMTEYGSVWSLQQGLMMLCSPLVFLCAIAYAWDKWYYMTTMMLTSILLFALFGGVLMKGFVSSDGVAIDMLSPAVALLIILASAFMVKYPRIKPYVFATVLMQTAYLMATI